MSNRLIPETIFMFGLNCPLLFSSSSDVVGCVPSRLGSWSSGSLRSYCRFSAEGNMFQAHAQMPSADDETAGLQVLYRNLSWMLNNSYQPLGTAYTLYQVST